MEWTEVEGTTYEEAVQALLNALGADKSEVEMENLGEARKMFGLGRKVIRVRGRLKREAFESADHKEEIRSFIEGMNAKPPAGGNRANRHERKPAESPGHRPVPEKEPSEAAKKSGALLAEILRLMNVEGASVETRETAAGEITLEIKSPSGGVLIGRKGETLEALQTVLEIYLAKIAGDKAQIVVDTENYRRRRQGALKDIADKAAQKAVKSGKRVPLGPMKASERKIIHTVLQENPDVSTRSEGEGDRRQVVVLPSR